MESTLLVLSRTCARRVSSGYSILAKLYVIPTRSPGATTGRNRVNQNRKKFLNTQEVAQWLGFSTHTITNWAVRNLDSGGTEGIPAYKLNDELRVDEDEA